MVSIATAFAFALFTAVFSSAAPNVESIPKTLPTKSLKTILDEGCNVNVCFALDGSGSVSVDDFDLSKFFAQDVANIVGTNNEAEFSAAQYGRITYPISPLTSNRIAFSEALEDAESEQDSRTSVGAGIVYCAGQLFKRRGDANAIVLIGDGRNNLGGSPARRARNFRRHPNQAIFVVGVGFQDTSALLEIAGGNQSRVLTVDDYLELFGLLNELVLKKRFRPFIYSLKKL